MQEIPIRIFPESSPRITGRLQRRANRQFPERQSGRDDFRVSPGPEFHPIKKSVSFFRECGQTVPGGK
jgi:hypothetical protein